MKKITFLFFFAFFSWLGHAQLPVEDFDGTGWSLGAATDWWSHQNSVSLAQQWRQSNTAVPGIEIPYDPVNEPPQGNCAFVNQQNGPNGGEVPKDWLVTPSFLVPANGQLKFQSRLGFAGNQGGIYKIMYTTDVTGDLSDLTIYQDVIQWTEPLLNPNQTAYLQKIVDLPLALVGQNIRLAFYMEGDEADRWMVDNVSVSEQCLPPTGLSVSGVTSDGATLNWVGSPTGEYEVEWMLSSEAPTFIADVTVTGTSTTIGPLDPATSYKFYVRAVCGDDDYSEWTLPYTFSTTPENDDCAEAVTLTVNPTNICTTSTFGTIMASTASPEANGCGGTDDDDVWYKFVATNTTHLVNLNNVTGSTTDLFHVVYSGTTCGALTQVLCSDPNSSTVNGLTVGQTYYVRVYSWTSTPNQTSSFNICIGTPPPPPANDECAGAVSLLANPDLNCTNFATGTVYSATASPQDAAVCSGTEDDDVWYSFVATNATHRITLTNITGSTTVLYHALYSGTCAGLTNLYCSTTNTSMAGALTVGNTYYIRVYSSSATAQTSVFDICVSTPPPPPANDNCPQALNVPVNPDLNCALFTPGTVAWATASPQDATVCGGTEDDDVWFSFVATNTTHTINLNNVGGSTTDLFHAVYSGACGTLTNLICSDPNNSLVGNLTVGNTYYIRVYTWTATAGQTSTFDVCVGTPPPPPANDNCADAIPVAVNADLECALETPGTIAWATPSGLAPAPCFGTPDDDVWFSFVATNPVHTINLNDITGSTTDLYHAVYSGACGSLTNMVCSDPNNSVVSGLTVGSTYYIRVYSWTSTTGQNSAFNVCVGTPPPPPANDECAGAVTVLTNPDLECGNVVSGTVSWATPSTTPALAPCTGNANNDVWYQFVATSTTHTLNYLDVTGSATFMYTAVYSGSACGSLTSINCFTGNSNIMGGLTVGDTYFIRVHTGFTSGNQTTTFDLCIGTPPPPPANDECANATALTVNPTHVCTTSTPGTIDWATPSGEGNTCFGTDDDDVWYTFVASNPIHIINLNNVVGNTDLYHVLYSGSVCGSLTQMYCSDPNQSIATGLTIGETYTIRVYTWTSTAMQSSTFDVCVGTPPPPPINDECAAATVVPVNPTQVCENTAPGIIFSATGSSETNGCGGTANDDVWFEFVATSETHTIELLNISGSTTDLYHVLYEGDQCGTLTQVYCSDPNSSFAQGLTVGNTYKIRVYSWTSTANQTSVFDVCVATPPPPPVNDECADAIVVLTNTGSQCLVSESGTIYSATGSTEAGTCGGTDDDDVWFEFVATSTSHFINLYNITGSTTDLYHAVYQGDECGALTQMYCSDNNSSSATNFVVGETYKVRVYSWTSTPNQTSAFDICIGTPNISIAVDGTTFTTEQLVQNVLFGSPCAVITNITSVTGTNFGQANGIGYFSAPPGCDFPFQDGVILATTAIQEATVPSGPGGTQNNAWLGDDDLEEIISEGGNNGPTNNATILEFDFMAYTDEFTFDFLFASQEYGTFQCTFSDAFAFILTDLEDPAVEPVNLAVIPGTTTPVSVVTIRDDAYNPGCDDQNVEYFGQYNPSNPFAAAIGFNGQTVPFTAVGQVEPGHQYHIKFVVADYNDSILNSAVFLGGGSFDVGDLDLGDDLTIDLGTAICNTETATLTVDLANADLFEFEWLYDSTPDEGDDTTFPEVIAGETEPTMVATESGRYYVRATFGTSDCSLEGDILVEMYEPIDMADPIDLIACDPGGFAEFDMTPNADLILSGIDTTEYNPADFTVTFHESQADAESGDNPVGPVFTNTVADVQPIYVRIIYGPSGCPTFKEFDLVVQDLTPEFVMPEDFNICAGTTDATITIVPENFDPTSGDVTISWTLNGGPSVSTDVTVPVTGPGIYEVTVNNSGCIAVDSVEVTETAIPVVDDLQDVNACDVYVLPALSANNRYFTGPDATGEEMFAGEEITSTVTLYIYAESATVPTNCFAQSDFVVNISPTPVFSLGGPYVSCDVTNLTVMVQKGANFDIATASYAWTVNGIPESGNSQITGTEPGTYTLIVTTAEGCMSAPVSVQVTLDTTVVALNPSQGCDGLQYKVNVEPVGDSYDPDTALISWSGPNGFSSSEASAVVTEAGDYTVTVVTEEGCMGEMTIKVENVGCMIPRGISPNDDTLNDNFDLTGFNVTKLSIFNRYGREVYSKTDYTDEWHGQTNGGEELPTGTYFYSIERSNGESKTGWVYINRQEN